MTDPILSEQDIQDIKDMNAEADYDGQDGFAEAREGAEPDPKHTLLFVWQEILTNIEESSAEKVTPAYANRIVGSWPKMSFQDVPAYHKLYHDKLIELRDILTAEIATDETCFEHIEDDAEKNRKHYLELLYTWQERVMVWEHTWNASAKNSHIVLAAIADASAFFVGSQGLIDHLGQIEFDLDEDAREALAERLVAAKEGL